MSNMKLHQLDARFLKFVTYAERRIVDSLAEADGVQFQCPKCSQGKELGDGFVFGAHYIVCWFRGRVPDGVRPSPGRWTPSGTSLDDLTFVPGTPPIAHSVLSGCGWHGYVSNGEAN